MSRKLLTMALVLVTVSVTSVIGYAGGDSTSPTQAHKVESQKIEKEVQIKEPSENSIQTEGDVVLITIKGKQGANVTLEVYLNTNVTTKEEFDLVEAASIKAEDYELILSENVEISSTGTGTYSKEIKLKKGLYKIVATKQDGGVSHTDIRYILCKGIDDAAKTLNNAKNSIVTPFIDTIKSLLNNK